MNRETPAYPARHDVRDGYLVVGGERVPVVVKRIRRDFRQPDGRTRAERSLRIARHLLAHGLDTPEPLGIEVTPEESVLVVRKVEGAVEVRAFFPVNLDINEEPVHHPGDPFIFKGFALHYVAPVAGGIADAQQNRFVLRFCPRQGFLPPRVPLDRIVRMLEEVGTGFPGKLVGKRGFGHRLFVSGNN